MKKIRKIIGIVIATVLMMSVMTGCGENSTQPEERITTNTEITGNEENPKIPSIIETHTHEMTRKAGEAATCEKDGRKEYWECESCGKKYKDKDGKIEITTEEELIEKASGHKYGTVRTEKEATCTENGREYRACIACGKRIDEKETEATGHKWDTGRTVRNATCGETGITEYSCEVCGAKREEETERTLHEYRERKVYATCESAGYTEHKCEKCGYEYRDGATEKTAHEYETTVIEATCEEAGKEVKKCRVCGEVTETEIPEKGHEYKERKINATCEENGYTEHKCNVCGKEYKDEYEQATGHEYGEWTESVAATCTEKGEERRECEKCGKTEKREKESTGHEMINGTCEKCGYTIPMAYELKSDGTYRVTGIGGYTGKEIRIPDEYEGKAVTEIADRAYNGNTEIESVVIGKNVKRIGKEAFYGCKNIERITFEDDDGWYTAKTSTVTSGALVDVKKSATDNAKNLVGNIYGKLYWLKK